MMGWLFAYVAEDFVEDISSFRGTIRAFWHISFSRNELGAGGTGMTSVCPRCDLFMYSSKVLAFTEAKV